MRVFVTGATGLIGTEVVKDLLSAGHEVVGLARSDASANALIAMGATVIRGALEDLDSLRQGAAEADGIIHLAFTREAANFAASGKIDKTAIETMGAVLKGSDRPFVITFGVPGFGPKRLVTENDQPINNAAIPRVSEAVALQLAADGVNISIVRPARLVHGIGDMYGFMPRLIDLAKTKGVSAYIGDGSQLWPAVNNIDIAHLYRLALEKGTRGAIFHGVAENVTFKAIAETIGQQLDIPVVAIPTDMAAEHFGFTAQIAAMVSPASSELTQKTLDWQPVNPTLVDDLLHADYFGK